MRMYWKPTSSTLLLVFMLLLNGISSIPYSKHKLLYSGKNHRYTCVGCVITISIVEQLAEVHNSTVKEALERLCGFFSEIRNLKRICFLILDIFGPTVIKLMETKMNADMLCYSIHVCQQRAGQPRCHLYDLPKVGLNVAIKESERMAATQIPETMHGLSSICSLPFLKDLCKNIEKVIKSKLPYKDFDGDKFSTFPTLRGYYWRGRDCDDTEASVHPGRRPDNWDAKKDSNCNGIWGVDPKDGIPYEQKFCNGTDSKGIIILGDSAAAHFHIPPEWITASKMSKRMDRVILLKFTQKKPLQPQRLPAAFQKCLARTQQFDKPAIVIFALIGNDVCNGRPDTVKHMTRPDEMRINVIQTLHYLDSQLPKGSHVLLTGLVNGDILWDNMHSRYHPLGQLNKDVTYGQLYSFLSCLQVNPCRGWMSSNSTLRELTTKRAAQLSSVLKEIAVSEKYANFDVFYVDYPLKEITELWHKLGGETWQLIEPVDGFHPNQIASALGTRILWEKVLRKWPYILGKENPFNREIASVFKDQGGH